MIKNNIRKGYYFYLFTTAIIAIQFIGYLLHSQIISIMDLGGWTFYLTSCISHAACLALPAFLIYVIMCLVRIPRIGTVLAIALSVIVSALILVNEQVYQLYRFHINGFVLNMVTGPAAGEIFTFDAMLYVKYVAQFLVLLLIYIGGWWWCRGGYNRIAAIKEKCKTKRTVISTVCLLIGSTLFAHIYHIFASFYEKQSVMACERLLPYYFPTTSYGTLTDMGLEAPVHADTSLGNADGDMIYPINPLVTEPTDSVRPNILILLVDSWNTRAFTKECMPNTYEYAQNNWWFKNHVSCSNGTRSSVFGLWFGISSYYWKVAEGNHITPAILDVAREEGYEFRNYPSAQQTDPPFGRVLFAKEKNVRIDTKAETPYERDSIVSYDFIRDIKARKAGDKPFLSFVFLDLPHSYQVVEGKFKFQPSWTFADYSRLNNDTDPTEFWNLYRNTCYETDCFIGAIIDALDETGLSDNTYVVITGDHSQEFNENKKNYWGHNGNFSHAQIGVPLVVHIPGEKPHTYKHRTTHYDITPTLMRRAMGVTNPIDDYSMGHDLADRCSRDWHVVGSELNYGFILKGDTILEKTAEGGLNIYDPHMNLLPDYHFDANEFRKATERLNHFMK